MTSYDEHLRSGATHLCTAWAVTRRDGKSYGFTDHDLDLEFEGLTFQAGSGLTGFAVSQSTGLSVDNSEALGALSSDAIAPGDLSAGRFDGAEIRIWSVVWSSVSARKLLFRGTIGAVRREGAGFAAELRGLTEALNQPGGRVFTRLGSAVAGGGLSGDALEPFSAEVDLRAVSGTELEVSGLDGFAPGWFTHGRIEVLSGASAGLFAAIKEHAGARLRLWAPMALAASDRLRLVAGCDGRFETYRDKFGNAAGFDGFPHIPGEDWLMAVPRNDETNDGGSLFGRSLAE